MKSVLLFTWVLKVRLKLRLHAIASRYYIIMVFDDEDWRSI